MQAYPLGGGDRYRLLSNLNKIMKKNMKNRSIICVIDEKGGGEENAPNKNQVAFNIDPLKGV